MININSIIQNATKKLALAIFLTRQLLLSVGLEQAVGLEQESTEYHVPEQLTMKYLHVQ